MVEVVWRGFPWGLIKLAGLALCRPPVPSSLQRSTVQVVSMGITHLNPMLPAIS